MSQFEAERQFLLDLPNSLIKICTQFDIITAVFHRNGYTYGWLTIKVHFRFSRFSIAAFDFGNITQTEGTVISLDRNIADIGQCIRGTGQTQIGISAVTFSHAGRCDSCFCLDRRSQCIDRYAQLCQLGIRHLDIDFFRLYSYQFYFFDIRYLKKFIFDIFGDYAHFLIGEAVRGDCVDISIDVVKTVVEKRS